MPASSSESGLTALAQYVRDAIHREKQLKNWSRKKKIALIEAMNPKWDDLSREWGKAIDFAAIIATQKKT